MGEDQLRIRQEIEDARARMGETLEAIGHKTDVPARAGEYVSRKRERLAGRGDAAVSKVAGGGRELRERASRAARAVRDDPIGLAAGAAALGVLAGLALPSTRVEDERMGAISDEVRTQAREAGEEALERGREVAGEAARSAAETARNRGSEEARALGDETRERAADVAPRAGSRG